MPQNLWTLGTLFRAYRWRIVFTYGLFNLENLLELARQAFHLNGRLNDELEREVEVIGSSQAQEVSAHYRQVARWRIKLSDAEAINFGLTEVFVLGLLALTLARFSTLPGVGAGDILAMFQYVWMFVGGLDSAALLVEQLGRLRDIGRRMRPDTANG